MKHKERTAKIIQFIKAYGIITNNDVQALMGTHRNTATKYFRQLVDEGLILSEGTGKWDSLQTD